MPRRKQRSIGTPSRAPPETDVEFGLSDTVLQALQGPSVAVQAKSSSWTLPQELLCRYSKYFRDILRCQSEISLIRLPEEWDPESFSLFVEWVLSGLYRKRSGYLRWDVANLGRPIESNETYDDAVEWERKACIWAWVVGYLLEAPEFMNYAMRTIFRIWMATVDDHHYNDTFFHPHAGIYASKEWGDRPSALRDFVHNLVLINWGDDSNFDHGDKTWLKFFNENPEVRDDVLLSMAQTSADRWNSRRDQLKLEKYLVDEDLGPEIKKEE